ncbi:MAG TPA: sigma 54-interacting transcriptional regulator [Anaerovoracaceae bacterium]|nr:sigma 54-interacting transcriptional regulator [Anaerovoracaceae bacterium]
MYGSNQNDYNELDYILDTIYEDILIADGDGVILRLSKSFEKVYEVNRDMVIGKTVFEMEKAGIFKPSITAVVLETKEKVTMSQKNNLGRDIVVTAVPIKDKHGNIVKVISFSRDITEYLTLQEQYRELENKVEKYAVEITELRDLLKIHPEIVAESDEMKRVMNLALKSSRYNTNILITGESGVGKSLLARFIHSNSSRSEEAFVEINCGAIPENLIESELFGYEPGSFTGANKEGKLGLVEVANRGTLFLDEISELSHNLQVKLLKVIQDKSFIKVGGVEKIDVDFCLITATNKNLTGEIENGRFREDLFYRINVLPIHIPPLRDRQADIIKLVNLKLKQFNEKYGESKYLSPKNYNFFLSYSWPGNIRELENTIERMIITSETEEISTECLPQTIQNVEENYEEHNKLSEAIDVCEKNMILNAYRKHKTSSGVARELGISQPTAYRKIKKYVGGYS